MVDKDKSCVDCIIHVGVVTVQLVVLEHKSWFKAELRFQEVLSINPPSLQLAARLQKNFFQNIRCI